MNTTRETPSTWPFFDTLDAMWSKTPKFAGLMGGIDSDAKSGTSEVPFERASFATEDVEFQEGGSSSQNPNGGSETIDLEGVVGKKVKQSKRSSLGAIARTMGDGLKEMCGAIREVEEKRIAALREMEASRHALQETIVRIREEEETKRQEMQLAHMLELSKLFLKQKE